MKKSREKEGLEVESVFLVGPEDGRELEKALLDGRYENIITSRGCPERLQHGVPIDNRIRGRREGGGISWSRARWVSFWHREHL